MSRASFFPILVLLAALITPGNEARAIYGGQPSPEGAYPFMVHMYIGDPVEGGGCGGVLISPTRVLTAAHCVPNEADEALGPNSLTGGESIEDYRVLVGRTDLTSERGEVIAVKAAYRHPDYDFLAPYPTGAIRAKNDVAVLELARPSKYPPVRIAGPNDVGRYSVGKTARVIGWGRTPDGTFPTQLMQVDVPVWDDAACKAGLLYTVMLNEETEVCAGAPGKDSCGGDSGGPLFVEETGGPLVFGIVAYGTECGDETYPGVYTEVAAYREFIDSHR